MNTRWRRGYQRFNRLLQLLTAMAMLAVAIDWATGDGKQRALLALLGAVMTVAKLLEEPDC